MKFWRGDHYYSIEYKLKEDKHTLRQGQPNERAQENTATLEHSATQARQLLKAS